MKQASKSILFTLSALGIAAALSAGCADSTQEQIQQTTHTAIANSADAMNTVATNVRDVSTNVATHVVNFSTNAWNQTKAGAQKVVQTTTNVVNDVIK